MNINHRNDLLVSPVELAIRRKQEEAACYLIQKNCDLNVRAHARVLCVPRACVCGAHRRAQFKGRTLLHECGEYGLVEVAKELLDRNVSLKEADQRGYTPLHMAVEADQLPIVEFFISRGSPVDAATKTDATPLHLAAAAGLASVTSALLKAGADVSKVDTESRSPWRLAISAGHDTVALMLREQWQKVIGTQHEQAAVAAMSDKDRERALLAAVSDDVPTIQELMAVGLPSTFADDHGTSLLMVAAAGGSMRVIEFLLSRGVSAATANEDGKTALHFAASHPDAFGALVAAGAELAAQDKDGRTAVHETAVHGWVDDVAVKAQAFDVSSPDLNGRTPLHDAAAHVQLGAIVKLLELGAPISRPDKAGVTPLHLAASHAAGSEAVRLLMQRGAVPSAKDGSNTTPLHLAIAKAHNVDSMCFLLEAGANVEAADASGVTPLRCAVDQGSLDLVVPLLGCARARARAYPAVCALSKRVRRAAGTMRTRTSATSTATRRCGPRSSCGAQTSRRGCSGTRRSARTRARRTGTRRPR